MLQCYKSITLLQPKACANRGSIHQLVQSLKRKKNSPSSAPRGRLPDEPTAWWPASHHSREADKGGRQGPTRGARRGTTLVAQPASQPWDRRGPTRGALQLGWMGGWLSGRGRGWGGAVTARQQAWVAGDGAG